MVRRRNAAWTLIDQIWVSGCNFAVGVLLARILGVDQFGRWVLLWAVMLYANTLAQGFVNGPMMSIVPRTAGDEARSDLLRGALGLQLGLSTGIAAVIVLLGLAIGSAWPRLDAGTALWPLALAVIVGQGQDWLRRYFFIQDRPVRALLIDVAAYGGQLASMVALHAFGRLDFIAAWWCFVLPFGLALGAGTVRERLRPGLRQMRVAFSTLGRAGRDYVLASQFHWAGSQGVLFVGAASLGAGVAGGVRSTQNLVGVANILFAALENLVPVRCATIWRERGPAAVKHYLMRILWLAGVPLLVFFVIVSVFSGPLVSLIYGPAFEPFAVLVVWQSAYMTVQFASRLLSYWCRTVDRTLRIALSTMATAAVSVVGTALLAPRWHEHGLMLALLLGALAALVVLAWPCRLPRPIA